MAIDDVISSYSNQIGDAAYFSIQPASGDEWLVTQIIVEEGASYIMTPFDDAGTISVGTLGGNTTVLAGNVGVWGMRSVRYFVTNSDYLRIRNDTGSTKNMGYSAIKTKD